MIRQSVGVALLTLLACQGQQPIIEPRCGAGALCALHITLVVTGQVRARANPLAGAIVHITAHHDSCSGAEIMLLPAPVDSRTDSNGVYWARAEAAQSVPSACLRVAYSDVLFTDTSGVVLHAPPAAAETVHVNVTGP